MSSPAPDTAQKLPAGRQVLEGDESGTLLELANPGQAESDAEGKSLRAGTRLPFGSFLSLMETIGELMPVPHQASLTALIVHGKQDFPDPQTRK